MAFALGFPTSEQMKVVRVELNRAAGHRGVLPPAGGLRPGLRALRASPPLSGVTGCLGAAVAGKIYFA